MNSKDKAFKKMVGARIRKARKKGKVARSVLAEFIGRSPQIIHMYEVGNRLPSTHALYNIAVSLNVSTDYLFGLED